MEITLKTKQKYALVGRPKQKIMKGHTIEQGLESYLVQLTILKYILQLKLLGILILHRRKCF